MLVTWKTYCNLWSLLPIPVADEPPEAKPQPNWPQLFQPPDFSRESLDGGQPSTTQAPKFR